MSNMQMWVDFAKQQKQWAVDSTNRGDIPPTIIVERNDEIIAVVISPEIDKRLGLQAAAMCHLGFDPDALIMVVDAHIHQGHVEEGQTVEEAQEAFRKKFPKGMQHACDNEDACAVGEISDCLICHRITRDGKITLVSLPYSYHGKDGGVPFQWLDDDERYKNLSSFFQNTDKDTLKGFIPDSLREIMNTPFNNSPELDRLREVSNFSPERVRFHISRAMISLLSAKDYIVADFISGKHPEWTDAKNIGIDLLSRMVNDGFFPKESFDPIKSLIEEQIGTKNFSESLSALLNAHLYWLPAEVRENIPEFIRDFENVCMSPTIPKGFDEKVKRVQVWNSDKSKFLGHGNLVDVVSFYAIEMPDGSFLQTENVEIEPQANDVPKDGVIRKMGKTPKIVLDNGQTVYGFWVFWELEE